MRLILVTVKQADSIGLTIRQVGHVTDILHVLGHVELIIDHVHEVRWHSIHFRIHAVIIAQIAQMVMMICVIKVIIDRLLEHVEAWSHEGIVDDWLAAGSLLIVQEFGYGDLIQEAARVIDSNVGSDQRLHRLDADSGEELE